MTNEQMHAEFEAHIAEMIISEAGLDIALKRDEAGDYETSWVQNGWQFWQAATMKAAQWRSIADAPRDGTEIGCWNPKEPGIIRRVKWGHHLKNERYPASWVTLKNSLSVSNLPTLWLPLPPTGTGGNHAQ